MSNIEDLDLDAIAEALARALSALDRYTLEQAVRTDEAGADYLSKYTGLVMTAVAIGVADQMTQTQGVCAEMAEVLHEIREEVADLNAAVQANDWIDDPRLADMGGARGLVAILEG